MTEAARSLLRRLKADRRLWGTFAALALVALVAWGYYAVAHAGLAPEQPIAFSHRVHATEKGISCFFCHTESIDTAQAGPPPMETCMLCHRTVIPDHPEVAKLRAAFEAGRPVRWVRVFDLPDHVFFDHASHVRAGVDCGRCHGDVAAMDRVGAPFEMTMSWCVTCHREEEADAGCLVCHR